jgi:hypothetical protein
MREPVPTTVTTPIVQTDLDRFHDPVKWNVGVLAADPNEIFGNTAEQEECHPVRRNQDAAEGLDRVCRIASLQRRTKAGKCLPDLLLAEPWPVALDDEGGRGYLL